MRDMEGETGPVGFAALLFDCDGVLLDSEPQGCGALARALTEAGHPMTEAEATTIFSGRAASDSHAWIAAQGLDPQRVGAEAERILYEMFDREIPLIPGIGRVLADFAVPMAVCSNSSRIRLARSLRRSPIGAHFGRHIWSADDVPRAKPAPDMALLACQELDVQPGQAAFIDDNIFGIHCARQAGCLAIGFVGPGDHRPGHAQTLHAAGAHHVVHGMDALHLLLTRLSLPLVA